MTTTRPDVEPSHTLVTAAFEGEFAPPPLSVAIVSLVELCHRAMPDPKKLRAAIVEEAKFDLGPQERAVEIARTWALDNKLIAAPVTNLRHEVFGRERSGEPVLFLLSTGTAEGKEVVFCSVLFRGVAEADVVKAVNHVTKRNPFGGGRAVNADGGIVRRVFWDVQGDAGIRAIAACGPDNVDALDLPRAIVAFNQAANAN
ncbi:MAG: hypothetical protein ABL883_08670 [Terricaulis sp.]